MGNINIDCGLLVVTETVVIKTLLFGNCFIDAHAKNTQILNPAIEYILIKDLMSLYFVIKENCL